MTELPDRRRITHLFPHKGRYKDYTVGCVVGCDDKPEGKGGDSDIRHVYTAKEKV